MAGKMKKSEASSSSRSNTNTHHRAETVVVDYGKNKSTCGYCKSKARTSISHGLWAHSVKIDDYQDLLDRGWRRSGCFLYKPEMERTCCPAYTIRLKAGDFVHSKEQLRVSRRMQRFLDGALEGKQPVESIGGLNGSKDTCGQTHAGASSSASRKNKEKDGEEKILNYLSEQVEKAICSCLEKGEFPDIQCPKASVKKVLQGKRKLLAEGSEELLYSSSIAFQLAAAIRRCLPDKKEANKGRQSGDIAEEDGLSPKLIAVKIESLLNQLGNTSGLSVKACNGHLNFYSATTPTSSHGSAQIDSNSNGSAGRLESKGCSLKNSNSEYTQIKSRRLEIRLKRSSFDSEEYALYRRYQMTVHNDAPDHVTESSYKRFLVDTPLIYVPPTNDGTVPPCGFGSFHQQYLIDRKLVAVGVIDILPKCLSSKYLFWDPDFGFLSLGKYSALQEINWVKENEVHCSTLQYYYLGYYIHSCSKMRYKAAYRPSELLCPVRYQWVPFDISKPLLDRNKYAVLSDCTVSQDRHSSSLDVSEDVMEIQHDDIDQDSDFMYDEGMMEPEYESSDNEPHRAYVSEQNGDGGNVLIGLKESRVRFKDIKQAFGPTERSYLESQLRRYTEVVGEELAERMVYSIERFACFLRALIGFYQSDRFMNCSWK